MEATEGPERSGDLRQRLRTFWGSFWGTVVGIGVLATIVFGAAQLGILWVLAPLLLLALAAGLFAVTRPTLQRWRRAVTEHPVLVGQLEKAQADLSDLRQQYERSRASLPGVYEQGRTRGILEVLGYLKATRASMPTITHAETSEGRLVLLAELPKAGKTSQMTGARYSVEAVTTGESKGVVAVVHQTGTRLTLECTDEAVPEYWQGVREKAVHDFSAPDGVRLTPAEPEVTSGFHRTDFNEPSEDEETE